MSSMAGLMSDSTTRPGLADLAQQPRRKIAGPAGDIQGVLTRAQTGQRQREVLPQPMRAKRHQIVHDIVFARDRRKNGAHALRLVGRRDLFEAKIHGGIGISHGTPARLQGAIVAESAREPRQGG